MEPQQDHGLAIASSSDEDKAGVPGGVRRDSLESHLLLSRSPEPSALVPPSEAGTFPMLQGNSKQTAPCGTKLFSYVTPRGPARQRAPF